jgi:hypothetical protein
MYNVASSLGVIRGYVAADGSITAGTGFTVSHPSTGVYTITFSPNFGNTAVPVVAIAQSPYNASGFWTYFHVIGITAQSSVAFTVNCQTATYYDGTLDNLDVANMPFTFIAIGPR